MNIYLTLDYELFLGSKTGTPDNCLIRPMSALCEAVEKYGVRFTIFVDAAYLLRLRQLQTCSKRLQKDFELVTNNIQDLHKRGHDIQLHFHPQWLYSNWNEKEGIWNLDYSHYKLSDMDKEFAFQAVSESKNLLESLIGKKLIAFRAGGYCLESFEDYILLFDKNGITVDSSVARGKFNLSGIHYFDYRKMPDKNQIYRFESTVREESSSGRFIEAPISFCQWNKLYYLLFMRQKKQKYRPKLLYGDGVSIGKSIEKGLRNSKKRNLVSRVLSPATMSTSSSGPGSVWLNDYFDYAIKHHWPDLVIIGHPKEETDSSVVNLESFIKKVNNHAVFKIFSEI